MAYILAVNPNILGNVMDASGVVVATAIASVFATFVMGLLANYPIGLSAGMGMNAYFAFTLCLGDLAGDPNAFRIGLTAVFLEGIAFIFITLSFLYIDFFNTIGTVVGVADKAGLLDNQGNLPRVGRVFMADALGTVAGACLGTSTVTSYIESSAGVAAGGRTGLTAMVVGALFLFSLVLSPVFLAIQAFATAPALIYVGMLMVQSATRIDFSRDYVDAAGAFMAILITPLTYSVANGITFAIITWLILKIACGRRRERAAD